MRTSVVATAVVAAFFLSGCGGDSTTTATSPAGSGGTTSSMASAPAATTTTAATTDAGSLAAKLQAAVPSITKVVRLTENNDPNNKIGRPGGYTDGAVLYDSGVPACQQIGSDCGAMIEVWPDAISAKGRAAFIQAALKGANGVLGTEYDYVDGPVLLRVSGVVKPSAAKKYESAFGGTPAN